jgi:transcriptional regulator with PAS, ATPase and Fis domain
MHLGLVDGPSLEKDSGVALGTGLIVRSAIMANIARRAAEVARRRSTVMLLGETGCGKEMLARHIHAHSDRADGPFVPVDCAAITETLFESQLFGHVRGAFTGATRDSLGFVRAAEGGTLFLDEIGELPLALQAKLLRMLQERSVTPVGDTRPRPVDVRVITATNADLAAMVQAGTFRQDLYYRLNVVELQIPPLRQRRSDIAPLAQHFLDAQAAVYDEPRKTLTEAAAGVLVQYAWPGNVRELANVMEHAHVLSQGEQVDVGDLPERLAAAVEEGSVEPDLHLLTIERHTILKALRRTRNNKAAAARLLGINIQRLKRRIIRLKIGS